MSNRRIPRGVAGGQLHHTFTAFMVAPALAMALLCAGCGKEQEIAAIQKAADAKVAKVEEEAKAKLAALQQQVEAVKAEAADASAQAKAMADEAISKAQSNVDEAAKEAQAALAKAREAYKADARTHLAEVNKEFTELAVAASKLPAKEKAGYDKAAKAIAGIQKDIQADITAFDKAEIETFKTAKAKLAKDLALMKAAIKTARAKLPKH